MQITTLTAVPSRELFPGYRARLVHSDRMTFSYVDVDATFAEHDHPHEQVIHLLDGEFELTIDGETRRMTSGQVAASPRARGTGARRSRRAGFSMCLRRPATIIDRQAILVRSAPGSPRPCWRFKPGARRSSLELA